MFQPTSSWESGMSSPILKRLSLLSSFDFGTKDLLREPSFSGSLDTVDKSPNSTIMDYNKDPQHDDKLFDFCGLLEYQPMPGFQYTEVEEELKQSSPIMKGSNKIHKNKKSKESKHSNDSNPKTRRDNWKPEEDAQLLALYKEHGPQWSKISSFMTTRTGKQVRERYINVLRPDISHEEWTEEEERKLMELGERLDKKWCRIVAHLPGRTETQVKNKFQMLQKKLRSQTCSDVDGEQSISKGSPFNKIPESSEVDEFFQFERREISQVIVNQVIFSDNFRELSWTGN